MLKQDPEYEGEDSLDPIAKRVEDIFRKPPYNSGFAIYLYLKAIDPMIGPTYFQ